MTWLDEIEFQADLAAKKAREEKAVETAQKMLEENISAEIIAKCTSLPLEKVLELQKQAKTVRY